MGFAGFMMTWAVKRVDFWRMWLGCGEGEEEGGWEVIVAVGQKEFHSG